MAARKRKARRRAAKPASRKQKAPPRSPKLARSRPKKAAGQADRGGRPAIDWTETAGADVHKMARVGNTVADMATILDVSKRSLEAAISKEPAIRDAYQRGCADRHDALRTAQLRAALRGNATMLIWLGKQELGQRDYKQLEISGPGGEPLALEADLAPVVKRKLVEFLRSRGKQA